MTDSTSHIALDDASDVLKGFRLPSQPKLLAAIQNVYPELDAISDVIVRDPGLSSSILKVINSPLFSLETAVISPAQGVMLLGLKSVMNVINAVLMQRALSPPEQSQGQDAFWSITSNTAIAMTTIIRQLNANLVDEAYCVGLFHNAGMLLLESRYKGYFDYVGSTANDQSVNITEVENKAHNTNHAVLGYFLCKSWGLSEEVCEAIRMHHDLVFLNNLANYNCDVSFLVACLKLAENILNEQSELGCVDGGSEWDIIGSSVLDYMGLSQPDYLELCDLVMDRVEDSSLDSTN